MDAIKAKNETMSNYNRFIDNCCKIVMDRAEKAIMEAISEFQSCTQITCKTIPDDAIRRIKKELVSRGYTVEINSRIFSGYKIFIDWENPRKKH